MSDLEGRVRAAYAAYDLRDRESILDLFDPEIEIHQTPLLPWGGRYRGLEEAAEFYRRLAQHVDSRVEPHEVFHAGDTVVVTGRVRGTARVTGSEFDIPIVHLWTFREGRVVGFHPFIDTPAMLRALG
jgi:ketosteroid isomerase-like protein